MNCRPPPVGEHQPAPQPRTPTMNEALLLILVALSAPTIYLALAIRAGSKR